MSLNHKKVEARVKGREWRPFGLLHGRHSTLFGLGGLLALVRRVVTVICLAASDTGETRRLRIAVDLREVNVSECHVDSLRSSSLCRNDSALL
jgi:hypothetical protein